MANEYKREETISGQLPPYSPAKRSKKRRLIILAVAAVLLIGGLAWALEKRQVGDSTPAASLQETQQKSNILHGQKNYTEALNIWNEFLKSNPPAEERSHAYKEIASLHINKDNNYSAALENYKKAEELGLEADYSLMLGIATLAEKSGDKATAREYYQKAILALDPNDPVYEADKAGLEDKVKALQ